MINSRYMAVRRPGRTGRNADLEPGCVNMSRRLEDTTPSHQRPVRRYDRGLGSRHAGTRVSVPSSCGQRRAAPPGKRRHHGRDQGSKDRASRAHLTTEWPARARAICVPPAEAPQYLRARIARRNAQGWWQPPDLAGGPDEASAEQFPCRARTHDRRLDAAGTRSAPASSGPSVTSHTRENGLG
jgi:hypothetical protein